MSIDKRENEKKLNDFKGLGDFRSILKTRLKNVLYLPRWGNKVLLGPEVRRSLKSLVETALLPRSGGMMCLDCSHSCGVAPHVAFAM